MMITQIFTADVSLNQLELIGEEAILYSRSSPIFDIRLLVLVFLAGL